MGKSFKLSECRELTPAVNGIGAWAEKLRQAAFNAVKEADIEEIMSSLPERAKQGDNAAAKLVLGYLTGGGAPPAAPAKPASVSLPAPLLDLIEALTQRLEETNDAGKLAEARGKLLGVRNGANGFEVVGALSEHATEQEAEKALRRLLDDQMRKESKEDKS